MEQSDRFSSYHFGEGRTGVGQLVEFSYPSDVNQDTVKEFLLTNVRTIDRPTTGRVEVEHGAYGMCSRYDVTQHKYAGGGSGFIEVLEIKNPPDGRWGFVINERPGYKDAVFTEWETLTDACGAFEKFWGSARSEEEFPKLPGFKRLVVCGALTPWFYAIGDEQLIGDYAFPYGLQDDAVYRFGRKFVVFDHDGVPEVKTCMGTRFVKRKSEYHPYEVQQYRLVYWDDGSAWDENKGRGNPRPLEEGELWITEAVQQFRQMLAGKNVEFTINFIDGNKFVGKLVKANHRVPCAEGDYDLVVRVKGEKKSRTGWIRDFKPTKVAPDIVQYVIQHLALKGHEVEHVEIKRSLTKTGGNKWSGVFLQPSP